jgi:hypothetical protein
MCFLCRQVGAIDLFVGNAKFVFTGGSSGILFGHSGSAQSEWLYSSKIAESSQ